MSMDGTEPALVLTGVGKSIGGRALVAGISLAIARGQIHALLGPNGSGKTTLLRLIAGIWPVDTGSIERHHGPPHRIGYVPQRFGLYDELTVRENLNFQAQMRGGDLMPIEQAEREFDLAGFAMRRAGTLSGGQRQRLLLAAALLHRPTLVLCDEPTTALDRASRSDLWALLRREARAGTTVVLTTHEEADTQACDTVTQLQDGRIVVAPSGAHGCAQ
jgi:ABC-2 type transport system ATP-binding protein